MSRHDERAQLFARSRFGHGERYSLGIYERLSVRWKQPTLATGVLATGAGIATLGGLLAAAYFVVVRSASAAQRLSESFEHDGTLRKLTQRVELLASSLRLGPIDLTSRIRTGAAEAASWLAGWVGAIAGATLGGCLTLSSPCLRRFSCFATGSRCLRASSGCCH